MYLSYMNFFKVHVAEVTHQNVYDSVTFRKTVKAVWSADCSDWIFVFTTGSVMTDIFITI